MSKIKNLKIARQPEVIRTIQKDLQYTTEINQDVLEVTEFIVNNNRNFIKFRDLMKIATNIIYHGYSAINRLQTLGEEYTGIIQFETRRDNIPKKLIQVISIVLEFAGESFLIKVLSAYEKRVKESEELTSEARDVILKIIIASKASIPYIKAIHKGLFYLNATSQGQLQISKKLTGIHYVLIRFWLNDHHSLNGYKFLGIFTLLQVLFSLLLKFKEKREEIKATAASISSKPATHVDRLIESTRKCILCLENRTDLTLTTCGHVYCWTCILDWIKFKNNCPVCRDPLNCSSVIFLQNYY